MGVNYHQKNKDIEVAEWNVINRALLQYHTARSGVKFIEPFKDNIEKNQEIINGILIEMANAYRDLARIQNIKLSQKAQNIASLNEVIQEIKVDVGKLGIDLIEFENAAELTLDEDRLDCFKPIANSVVKTLESNDAKKDAWKNDINFSIEGFTYVLGGKENLSEKIKDFEEEIETETIARNEDFYEKLQEQKESELDFAKYDDEINQVEMETAPLDPLTEKKYEADEGPNAYINIKSLTMIDEDILGKMKLDFNFGFFSKVGISVQEQDTKDYSIEDYKKGLLNVLELENCDMEVAGPAAYDYKDKDKKDYQTGELIQGRAYKQRTFRRIVGEYKQMSKEEVIERYREIEAEALNRVLGGGNALNAHHAFIDKESLENGVLNFDVEKIEQARNLFTDEELYAIYVNKIPTSSFEDEVDNCNSILPKTTQKGVFKDPLNVSLNSIFTSLDTLRNMNDIHKARGFWWKVAHPFKNHTENSALKSIKNKLLEVGVKQKTIDKAMDGTTEEFNKLRMDDINAIADEVEKQIVYATNENKFKETEKEIHKYSAEAMVRFVKETLEKQKEQMDVKVDSFAKENYDNNIQGIAQTLKNAFNNYRNLKKISQVDSIVTINSKKPQTYAIEGMEKIVNDLNEKLVSKDFIELMKNNNILDDIEYEYEANKIYSKLTMENVGFENTVWKYKEGPKDVSTIPFEKNTENEQKELEEQLELEVNADRKKNIEVIKEQIEKEKDLSKELSKDEIDI